MSPKDGDSRTYKLSGTDLIHGDSIFNTEQVAPAISVTTTFRHPEEFLPASSNPKPDDLRDATSYIYSRRSQPTVSRVERVLSKITGGYAIVYGSGLSAAVAALNYYRPKRIAIRGGYHGIHFVIDSYKRGKNVDVVDIDANFAGVDLCWIETPLNPTGEARNIQHYADKIHAVGGHIVVDATFAPPPLQYPFKWGTDMILHSGSKYFGGHSDLLNGTLVVKTVEEWGALYQERLRFGSGMGSLESWLLLRSLRTLHLRVPRQSASATTLAQWLERIAKTPKGQKFDGIPGGLITKVWHSSLQGKDGSGWSPEQQMEGGHSPTFAIQMASKHDATFLPHAPKYFVPATSLGGVESLIEQRARSSLGEDARLVRISVGVEDVEDLQADLRRVFLELSKRKAKL